MDELLVNMRRIGLDSVAGTLGNHGYTRHGVPRQPTYGRDMLPARVDRRDARVMALDSRRKGVKVPDFFELIPEAAHIKKAF
jgi:hypothetical protein